MSSFDPSELGQRSDTRRTKARALSASSSWWNAAEGFHHAVGHKADKPNEKIKVRLNAVQERLACSVFMRRGAEGAVPTRARQEPWGGDGWCLCSM